MPFDALRVYHDEVSNPGSDSCVALSVTTAEDATFHDGMGSASVKVAMLIAQATSHRAAFAWYNRIVNVNPLQKTREEIVTWKGIVFQGCSVRAQGHIVPASFALGRMQCNLYKEATPKRRKRGHNCMHIAGSTESVVEITMQGCCNETFSARQGCPMWKEPT